MAAFKQHCSFGFWKTKLIPDPYNLLTKSDEAMGQLGKIAALTDLPDEISLSAISETLSG